VAPVQVGAATEPEAWGSMAEVLRGIRREADYSLDYWHRGSLTIEEWRRRGRAEVERTLDFHPKPVPIDLKVHSSQRMQGYELRTVSFAGCEHYRIPGLLLIPDRGKAPFPAVLALHDHGAYFFFGKEKLVEVESEHASLTAFKKQYYGSRSYASELARRGFVVLVTDAFFWGERRIRYEPPPPALQKMLTGLKPEQAEYVAAQNQFLGSKVFGLNTKLAFMGANWLGIVIHDDRRSLDVLCSLDEVNKSRIGAMGLSVGGYRTTYISGLDPRIRAAVVVGWMTALGTMLDLPENSSRGLMDAFGLHRNLDHPDVASLGAPDCALLVQQCGRDGLFTVAGMRSASDKLRRTYEDLKKPDRFRSQFYDVPHSFTQPMQADAFDWLDHWLKDA